MNIAYLYGYVTKKTGPATSIRGLCGPDEFEVNVYEPSSISWSDDEVEHKMISLFTLW